MLVAFDAMDASGSLNLDLAEVSPYLQYTFAILFGVELTPEQAEELYLIIDTDQSAEVFAPFLRINHKFVGTYCSTFSY